MWEFPFIYTPICWIMHSYCLGIEFIILTIHSKHSERAKSYWMFAIEINKCKILNGNAFWNRAYEWSTETERIDHVCSDRCRWIGSWHCARLLFLFFFYFSFVAPSPLMNFIAMKKKKWMKLPRKIWLLCKWFEKVLFFVFKHLMLLLIEKI